MPTRTATGEGVPRPRQVKSLVPVYTARGGSELELSDLKTPVFFPVLASCFHFSPPLWRSQGKDCYSHSAWHQRSSACQCRRRKRCREFSLWVGKIPWRRKWRPTSVFWPGKIHGQRSPVGYGAGGWTQLSTEKYKTSCLMSHKQWISSSNE